MKVRLYFDGGNLGRLALAMFFSSLLCFWIRFPVWVLLGFGALYFFIKSLKIELHEKFAWLWTLLMIAGSSIFSA